MQDKQMQMDAKESFQDLKSYHLILYVQNHIFY